MNLTNLSGSAWPPKGGLGNTSEGEALKRVVCFVAIPAVIMGGAADKCDPNQKGLPAGYAKACDIRLHAPETALLGMKATVGAVAETTCDRQPVSHHLKVWLEKKVNGTWTQQSLPGGESAGNCDELPPSGSWVSCRFVLFDCSRGQWRTRALVTGTSSDGIPFAYEPDEKPSALIVSCPSPK